MALRTGIKVEDLVVGTFALIAAVYPFIIALIIHFQERPTLSEDLARIREVYSVILGLVSCKYAEEVAPFIDPSILARLGGEEGIEEMCRRNRSLIGGRYRIVEAFEERGEDMVVRVEVKLKERGRVETPIVIELVSEGRGDDLRIKEIRYVKGS